MNTEVDAGPLPATLGTPSSASSTSTQGATQAAEHPAGQPIVTFENVHKTFGNNRVLRGLSLEIVRGKITFIIGRSGEGKSVTIKHIVGLLRPDTGLVTINGMRMDTATPRDWASARQKIGLLFQDGALFDSLSVAENIAFPLVEFEKFSAKKLSARVEELLELVGLPGKAKFTPPELSIGEKKRVGLARALVLKPDLLLYDEPTTGMDSLVSELIDHLIADMQQKLPGLSSVVISHDVHSIMKVAEHIILLHEGKVYLQGSPAEFRASSDPLIVQFLTGALTGPLGKPIA